MTKLDLSVTLDCLILVQVFAIEFVAFAIEFVGFAVELVGFAIELKGSGQKW